MSHDQPGPGSDPVQGSSVGADPAGAPRYRRPTQAPGDVTFENLSRWAKLTAVSAVTTSTTAQTWRNGLAGFVTLLTSVLILQGSDVADLESPWRYVVTGAIGAGAAAAVFGLWLALEAEAPPLARVSLDDVLNEHGSIAAFEQSVHASSTESLTRAKVWVMVALVAILVGTMTWWLTPTSKDDPDAYITVEWLANSRVISVCGSSLPAPDGELQIRVKDAKTPVRVSIASIKSVKATSAC